MAERAGEKLPIFENGSPVFVCGQNGDEFVQLVDYLETGRNSPQHFGEIDFPVVDPPSPKGYGSIAFPKLLKRGMMHNGSGKADAKALEVVTPLPTLVSAHHGMVIGEQLRDEPVQAAGKHIDAIVEKKQARHPLIVTYEAKHSVLIGAEIRALVAAHEYGGAEALEDAELRGARLVIYDGDDINLLRPQAVEHVKNVPRDFPARLPDYEDRKTSALEPTCPGNDLAHVAPPQERVRQRERDRNVVEEDEDDFLNHTVDEVRKKPEKAARGRLCGSKSEIEARHLPPVEV